MAGATALEDFYKGKQGIVSPLCLSLCRTIWSSCRLKDTPARLQQQGKPLSNFNI